jgi:antitoxin (DNA-binding transcriptional repressor) of toxin-antitoxin stability system
METAKVSVRDFRNRFSDYSESGKAVAVTKHGRTVGFYIPVRRKPAAEDLATFREAGRVMQEWMAENGVTEEDLVEDFKQLRKEKAKRRG